MRSFAAALLILPIALLATGPASALADAEGAGTDYWLAFPETAEPGGPFKVLISAPTAASGTVSVPGTAFSQAFNTTQGQTTAVVLPEGVEDESPDSVQSGKAVHVSANVPVKVYGAYLKGGLSDGYLGFPTEALGTDYGVIDYPANSCGAAQFEVVGTQAATTVTIESNVKIGSHTAGSPYTVNLGAGSAYLGQVSSDLSGTQVSADHPVAVLAGNSCGQVPVSAHFANYLIEELPPVSAWGTDYSVEPFAARTAEDELTLLGSEDGTALSIKTAAGEPAGAPTSLNAGQAASFFISQSTRIKASAPILVAQFAEGSELDGMGEPTMVLVPPREHYAHTQTITTPSSGFASDYLNISIASADIGTLKLDGTTVASSNFHEVGDDPTMSGASLSVSAGTHTLTDDGPFGVEVYGFDPLTNDAFGWPGSWGDGSRVAPPVEEATVHQGTSPSPSPSGGAHKKKCRRGFQKKKVHGKARCVKIRKRHRHRH